MNSDSKRFEIRQTWTKTDKRFDRIKLKKLERVRQGLGLDSSDWSQELRFNSDSKIFGLELTGFFNCWTRYNLI